MCVCCVCVVCVCVVCVLCVCCVCVCVWCLIRSYGIPNGMGGYLFPGVIIRYGPHWLNGEIKWATINDAVLDVGINYQKHRYAYAACCLVCVVCICIYVCMYVCAHMFMYTNSCVCLYVFITMCTYVYVYVYLCVYADIIACACCVCLFGYSLNL